MVMEEGGIIMISLVKVDKEEDSIQFTLEMKTSHQRCRIKKKKSIFPPFSRSTFYEGNKINDIVGTKIYWEPKDFL